MLFFKKILDKFDENDFNNENKKLKRNYKHLAEEIEKLKQEKEEITQKYIALLEEKGKGFDQYLHYHDLYGKYYSISKEQKKEIMELKLEINKQNDNTNTVKKSKKYGKKRKNRTNDNIKK